MKRLFLIFLILLNFSIYANNDTSFLFKIENAQTIAEKEAVYLERVRELSQSNTLSCDSIIHQRKNYVSDLSDDGKLTLLLINLNNSRLGGTFTEPNLDDYNFNARDLLLAEGLLKCFSNQTISLIEYDKIQDNLKHYSDPTRSSIYYSVSTCLEGIGREEVIDHFNNALKHAKRSPLKGVYSSVLDIFTSYFIEKEDFEQAIHYQQKAISYSKKHRLNGNLVNHLINIGHIQYVMGDFKKSEEALLEAQELCSSLKLQFIEGQLFNKLGELYGAQNQLAKSIRYYQQSLLRFYSINNIEGLALTHKNIGKAYFMDGSIDLAEKNYKLSEQFYKQLKYGSNGDLDCFFSELYFAKGQYFLAEKHILKAMDYWQKKELFISLNKAYLLFSNIKRKQGHIEIAYDYLHLYLKFSDSIHKLETNEKVAELSELFKSEQKERKIAEQGKKIEEEFSQRLMIESKLESRNLQIRLTIAILVISLILFVSIFMIIRNRNKQEQLIKKQREIELQQTLLRTQMNPHFIFNAMSVIQSYIYDEDVVNSSKFLIHFSKLMRMILENNAKQFIPLETELEIINRYLVLQKMRFEDRFDFEIVENETIDSTLISIPPMLVQPFIENSIEHGDLDKIVNGMIHVKTEIVEDLFIFTVEDNGIGRKKALQNKKVGTSENHRSMAIELTESRISLLNEKYKSKGYLRIEDLDIEKNIGTKVTIAIPFIKI
ncbi:MAG TPA: histidine kinase [Brumimicrobium sp.]|nr:histidine kinase [Brumimicrobium sp.]